MKTEKKVIAETPLPEIKIPIVEPAKQEQAKKSDNTDLIIAIIVVAVIIAGFMIYNTYYGNKENVRTN